MIYSNMYYKIIYIMVIVVSNYNYFKNYIINKYLSVSVLSLSLYIYITLKKIYNYM